MKQYIDVAQDLSGNALPSASVTVLNYPSGTAAATFSDNGLTPLSNVAIPCDVTGQFSFFVADGDYTLQLSNNGTLYKTQTPVSIFDGAAQLTFPDTGSANAYASSNSALEKALRVGLRSSILVANANTGASTYAYNGLAAKPIVYPGGTALVPGAFLANGIQKMEYDGTSWQVYYETPSSIIPQTAAEAAASVVPVNFTYAPGVLDRYQNNTVPGTTDMHAGMVAALASNYTVLLPNGPYAFGSSIVITGNKSIIGVLGGGNSAQQTQVVHLGTSSGALFSATSADFGSLYIGHLDISGGNGSYCFISTRPQSTFEYIHIEGSSGYNGSGFQLTAASQGSWETTLNTCKYVAANVAGVPVANAFRGYQLTINGGNTALEHCNATYCSVGIEVLQGQDIILRRCDLNECGLNATDSASAGQCGVRLGGAAFKQNVSIEDCYIEGCITSVWLDTCNNVSIEKCFFDDLGNTNTPAIAINGAAAVNVKIDTCWIQVRNSINTLACISNAGTATLIQNNTFNASNAGAAQFTLLNTAACVLLNNQNAATNHGLVSDASGLIQDITPLSGTWTPTLAGSSTAGAQTYSLNTGYYWKIGRRVFFDFVIIMTLKDGATAGNLQINGLPIACRNNAAGRIYSAQIAEHSNLTFVAGSQIGGTLNNNATSITLFQSATGGAVAALTAAALNNASAVYGSGSYDT